jgi:hypothetical protein
MVLPLIASLIVKKGVGKHLILRATAHGHVGGAVRVGHQRIGVMANKAHTKYISHKGKKWYFRRNI